MISQVTNVFYRFPISFVIDNPDYSSTVKPKLATLFSPSIGNPKIIECHEHISKRKANYQGTENLFNVVKLCDDSKSFIISINLCNMKNLF
jgi:hypothetical protein